MSYTYERGQKYSSRNRDEIDKRINDYLSRPDFEYDASKDDAYQDYAKMMREQGALAMEDTFGKATAATGGYGNSYAQTVGQQVYNDYAKDISAAQNDFYDRAFARYNAEDSEILDDISMLEQREENDRTAFEEAYAEDYAKALESGDKNEIAAVLGMSVEKYEDQLQASKTPIGEEQIQGYINALQIGDTAKGNYYSYLVNGGYNTDGLLDEVGARIASGEAQGLVIDGEVTYDEDGNAVDGRTAKSSYLTSDYANQKVDGIGSYKKGENFHVTIDGGDDLDVQLGDEVTDNVALTNKAKHYTGLLIDGDRLYYMAKGKVYEVEKQGWFRGDEYETLIGYLKNFSD